MKDRLNEFLDEGGRFVIKKENDKILVVAQVDMPDAMYHKGVVVRDSEDLINSWYNIVDASADGVNKIKGELGVGKT